MNAPASAEEHPRCAIHLKPNRDRSLRRFHPWILSGAVQRVTGEPTPGEIVTVVDALGEPLALAAFSPDSALRARVLSFDPAARVDATFIESAILHAVARRAGVPGLEHSCRLVFAEADGIPGLVADKYGDVVVFQITSVAAEVWRDAITSTLSSLPGITCVFERSEGKDRQRDGLDDRCGIAFGSLPTHVVAREGDEIYDVNVEQGHKTGHYLDQRDSRRLIADIAPGARVLNVFGYTGSFSIVAQKNGAASVTTVESSGPALEAARRNASANGVDPGELIPGDAFDVLRRMRDRRAEFDLIILDPPKYAASSSHVERATRKYKDINLLGIKLLAPNGRLMTFSCSGSVSADLFGKVVAGAAVDARRDMRIERHLGQPVDHPVPLRFPEAEYLKGLLLRAD
jgi:23S rRNA (cytosine1962-C5)-methyltransferase